MTDRITKTQRWLDLIAFLVGRRLPVSVEEIMETVPSYAEKWRTGEETDRASARRAFERDKDELREMGIPLETVPYRVGYEATEGYRLSRGDFYLPYLRLLSRGGEDAPAGRGAGRGGGPPAGHPARPPPGKGAGKGIGEVELDAADAGLALDALHEASELPSFPFVREARSAFRKLAFDLPPERFEPPPVLFADHPGSEEERQRLRDLSDALRARKRVRFAYHGIYRDETTRRDVAPYALVFQRGHWYLVGHDALREALRIFRVSRMRDLEVESARPHTPDYEIPEDFRVDGVLSRQAWELGAPDEEALEADVLFSFPRSLWAERNRHGVAVEERPGGATVRRFEVRQVSPFVRWILGLEGEAEVLSPPELREEVGAVATRVVALYEEEASDG